MPHLFITENASPFPSWQKVFPDHRISSPDEIITGELFDIIWFKLSFEKEAQSQLHWLFEHYGQNKIVVLTHIPRFVEAIQCLKGGARGYVNVFAGPQTLKQIADVVNEGGIWLGAELMQLLIASSQSTNENLDEKNKVSPIHFEEKLTAREIEVAKLIAKGDSNKVIARELKISERTVKSHVTTIFKKLEVKDRLKLAILLASK